MTGATGRSADGRRRAILAIDSATSQVVVAAGSPAGRLLGASTWAAGYRHGEQLLASIGRLLGELDLRRSRLDAIIVGTGPGAFTGLRVGLATAKGLAHALGRPIVGVSTAEALLAASAAAEGVELHPVALLLPAGPSDRVLVEPGRPPRLLAGGHEPDLPADVALVALDLDGRAAPEALARGGRARSGLAAALIRLGAAHLAASGGDDLARLVPEYVTLPRGIREQTGEVAWSRDPR